MLFLELLQTDGLATWTMIECTWSITDFSKHLQLAREQVLDGDRNLNDSKLSNTRVFTE